MKQYKPYVGEVDESHQMMSYPPNNGGRGPVKVKQFVQGSETTVVQPTNQIAQFIQ